MKLTAARTQTDIRESQKDSQKKKSMEETRAYIEQTKTGGWRVRRHASPELQARLLAEERDAVCASERDWRQDPCRPWPSSIGGPALAAREVIKSIVRLGEKERN